MVDGAGLPGLVVTVEGEGQCAEDLVGVGVKGEDVAADLAQRHYHVNHKHEFYNCSLTNFS